MDQDRNEPWTTERVEDWLVAAFKALPGAPVYSVGGRLQRGMTGSRSTTTDTLSWGAWFVPDRFERLALLTWARCASGNGMSFSEQCLKSGWSRATAERARRRAAALIAACLNSEQ